MGEEVSLAAIAAQLVQSSTKLHASAKVLKASNASWCLLLLRCISSLPSSMLAGSMALHILTLVLKRWAWHANVPWQAQRPGPRKATPSALFRYRNSLCKTGAHFVGRPVKREITESYTEDKYEARPDNIKVRACHVSKSLLLQFPVFTRCEGTFMSCSRWQEPSWSSQQFSAAHLRMSHSDAGPVDSSFVVRGTNEASLPCRPTSSPWLRRRWTPACAQCEAMSTNTWHSA